MLLQFTYIWIVYLLKLYEFSEYIDYIPSFNIFTEIIIVAYIRERLLYIIDIIIVAYFREMSNCIRYFLLTESHPTSFENNLSRYKFSYFASANKYRVA